MSYAGERPPRASLVNLETSEEYQFLFNPQTLEEKVEAKYARSSPTGLSHDRMQYGNTSNNKVPLELYLSRTLQDRLAGEGGSAPTIAAQRRWLLSLMYPAESGDVGYKGPPRVLLIWPRVLRMQCRVTSCTFTHRAFSNEDLSTTQLIAHLELEEDLDTRRTMEDVLSDSMSDATGGA